MNNISEVFYNYLDNQNTENLRVLKHLMQEEVDKTVNHVFDSTGISPKEFPTRFVYAIEITYSLVLSAYVSFYKQIDKVPELKEPESKTFILRFNDTLLKQIYLEIEENQFHNHNHNHTIKDRKERHKYFYFINAHKEAASLER